MVIKKLCVVTGTRSEYGLLKGLMERIQSSPKFELQLVVTAMHLSPEFGLTYKEIEKDGFIINEKIEMLLSGDTAVSVTKSVGLGVIGFADAYQRLQPDLLVILGDRFEALAAAQAAMLARIPIAHIHGGEITEGAIDESIRHSISKMSHLHFVAANEYRKRVIQLGEQPKNVFVSGAPGVDVIKNSELMDRESFESSTGFKISDLNFMVTYHPVTLAESRQSNSMKNLFAALDEFPEAKIIISYPNADAYGRSLISEIQEYAEANINRVYVFVSLGQLKYLSALQFMNVVIGNSSSGLIEAPSFQKPTVNIGDRQKGRLKAASVIDCDDTKSAIVSAIKKSISPEFTLLMSSVENPNGNGNASEFIFNQFCKIDLDNLVRKPFYDVGFSLED
ncbi:UDP-N-acetylglucosamine 2-epimerase [Aurantivibrio infirmus]